MIKRIYCKKDFSQNRKLFNQGKIYEVCRVDDDFSGDIEILTEDYRSSILIEVISGELIDKYKEYFKLIRNCQEEYMCKGTFGALMDCVPSK